MNTMARVGLAYAILAPIYTLASMQHGSLILSGSESWTRSLSMRISIALPVMLICVVLAFATGNSLVYAVLLLRLGDLVFEPYFYEKARTRNYGELLVYSGLRFSLILVAILAFSILVKLPMGAVLSIAAVPAIFVPIWLYREHSFSAELKMLATDRAWLWSGTFLGMTTFVATLGVNIPRYFLASAEPAELALYSNMLTLILGAGILYISAANMQFSSAASRGEMAVKRFFINSVLLTCGATGVLLAFSGQIDSISELAVPFVFGNLYAHHYFLVKYFSIFFALLYIGHVFGLVCVYANAKRLLFVFNTISTVLLAFFLFWEKVATAEEAILTAILVTAVTLVFFGALLLADGFGRDSRC